MGVLESWGLAKCPVLLLGALQRMQNVVPIGLEPMTFGLLDQCSNQLS